MNETVDYRSVLPEQRNLYYGGEWHEPHSGRHFDTLNPATGESLGMVAEAGTADIDAAVQSAATGFRTWQLLKPEQRAKHLYDFARVLREHAEELALLDAANCGNPVKEMRLDAIIAAAGVEYFAGLARETKGETLPMGPGVLNYSVRESGRRFPLLTTPTRGCCVVAAVTLALSSTNSKPTWTLSGACTQAKYSWCVYSASRR